MRLAFVGASYCHLFPDNDNFIDRTSGRYGFKGTPRPHFLQTPVVASTAGMELWQIERARELGAPVVHTSISDWSDGNVRAVKEALERNGQELVPAVGFDMMADGSELARETDEAIAAIGRYGDFGGIRLCKMFVYPMIYNRFQRAPGLPEQLERMAAALPPVVAAAEKAGIVLALENHLDYRVKETVSVIEDVGSPQLRLLLDIGNPLAVAEDPVEAARAGVPYTALVHLKDVTVFPFTPGSPGYFACMYVCPIGEGCVDVEGIVSILQAHAPDPADLALGIEMSPVPPYVDEDLWVEKSFAWVRAHLGRYLSEPLPASQGR